MAADEEKEQAPTAKRRAKAREDGEVVRSPDFMAFASFIAGSAALVASFNMVSLRFVDFTGGLLGDLGRPIDSEVGTAFFNTGAAALGPLMAAVCTASILVGLIQVGPYFNTKKFTEPNFKFLNIFSGIKRIMGSVESLIQLVFSTFKVSVLGIIAFYTLADWVFGFLGQDPHSLGMIIDSVGPVLVTLMVRLIIAMAVIAIADWCIKKYQHEKKLKMSIQELKDETKQSEGSPEAKGARKRKQYEMAQQRSIQNVAKADVVVVNPTHFAVALAYSADKMDSPKVVAKGSDELASRIRLAARKSGVPILPRPPLARALYNRVKVGQSIPEDLFQAVAVVLAYVYKLRKKRGAA